jgi:flagellar motility protein MotE (MotC chaperone)
MQETFKKYFGIKYILDFVVSLAIIKIIVVCFFAILNFDIQVIASTVDVNKSSGENKKIEEKAIPKKEKTENKDQDNNIKHSGSSGIEINPEILKIIQAKNAYLTKREEEINEKTRDFELVQSEIESRIKTLEELEKKLSQLADEIGAKKKEKNENQKKQQETDEKTKNERLQYLAGVYSQMEPGRAAELLSLMDVPDAAKIFSLMKTKKVAPVMAQMNSEKASSIAKALTSIGGKNPVEDDNKTNE